MKLVQRVQHDDVKVNLIQDRVVKGINDLAASNINKSALLDALVSTQGALKLSKPSFRYASTTSISIPASTTQPVFFIVGDKVLKTTTTLTCDLSGPGMASGVSLSTSTIYYAYVVETNDAPRMIVDTRPPTSGPINFSAWTYLGAFATRQSAATVIPFVVLNGMYIGDEAVTASISTSSTSFGIQPVSPRPTTIKYYYGVCSVYGTVVAAYASVNGAGVLNADALYVYLQVSGVTNSNWGFVSAPTPGSIYLKSSSASNTAYFAMYGWIEDPSEYP